MDTNQIENPQRQLEMRGRKWSAEVTGRKAMNGEPYTVQFHGSVVRALPGHSIYEVAAQVAVQLKASNPEMEIPESIRIVVQRLGHPVPKQQPMVPLGAIQHLVTVALGTPVVFNGSRKTEMVWPRFVFFWIARKAHHSFSAIARYSGQHHTAIMWGIKGVEEQRSIDAKVAKQLAMIEADVEGRR